MTVSKKDSILKKRPLGRAAAIGLTRERIVEEAIALIDDEGLTGFSVRALARRLQVYPTALYWHVGGAKADLFAEISGSLIATLVIPDEISDDWRETIRILFRRFRARIHEHPRAAPLLGPHIRSNGAPNAPWVEVILHALTKAGFDGQGLINAFNAIVGALEGYVTIELAADSAVPGSEWVTAFDKGLEDLDRKEFPLVTQHLPQMYNRAFVMRWQNGEAAPLDDGYDFLLETLILGLEAQVRNNRETPPQIRSL
jgi:AcrR family transcriptional regulator